MPALFDRYRAFTPRPALYFALPVARARPRSSSPLFGGGYIASGQAGKSRLPTPANPRLRCSRPRAQARCRRRCAAARRAALRIGDRVWFRPAKAGEPLERFDTVHLVEDGRLVESVPTYRGEGKNFG